MRTVSPHWSFEVLLDYFEQRGGADALENEMLRDFFPDQELGSGELSLELFEKHFLLHRRLYCFDDELRMKTGRRLSIRMIRFRLLESPPVGTCAYLLPDEPAYCGRPADRGFCPVHFPTLTGTDLESPGLRGYYMDWTNLHTMDEEKLQRMVDQFFRQVFQPDEVQKALEILGLEPGFSEEVLRQRWVALSKTHHPDAGGILADYQKINAAYQFLKSRHS